MATFSVQQTYFYFQRFGLCPREIDQISCFWTLKYTPTMGLTDVIKLNNNNNNKTEAYTCFNAIASDSD